MKAPRVVPLAPMRVAGTIASRDEARMLEQAILLFEIKNRLRPTSSRR